MEKSTILMNILNKEQKKRGYLSEDALKKIAVRHNIPIAQLYGVASFYSRFHLSPQGKHKIELCGSPSCLLNNGAAINEVLKSELGISMGQTTPDKMFSIYKSSCIGCCDMAPAMLVDGKPFGNLTVERVKEIIAHLREGKKLKGTKKAKKPK